MAGDGEADGARFDDAAVGLDRGDTAAGESEAGDFAILDDVDAQRIGAAGIAPGDGVVPGDAAAALIEGAEDRESARCR